MSGVSPSSSTRILSTPAWLSRIRTTPSRPAQAARKSADRSWWFVALSPHVCLSERTSTRTAPSRPFSAACMSGVMPWSSYMSVACFSISTFITSSAGPPSRSTARCSAVLLPLLLAFTSNMILFASMRTMSAFPASAAIMSSVFSSSPYRNFSNLAPPSVNKRVTSSVCPPRTAATTFSRAERTTCSNRCDKITSMSGCMNDSPKTSLGAAGLKPVASFS
jgi:hypothetical protein